MSLQTIRIRNFRAYGPNFFLQLPSPNGVLLLSGANGLGKTSFFEAIEWGLTGAVRRLDRLTGGKVDAGDLVRKGCDTAAARVTLLFSSSGGESQQIERSIPLPTGRASAIQTGTPIEAVARILSMEDERWGVSAENLSQYLLLTHSHPQSAALRLIARAPNERWNWVSQLAGTEKFETIRRRLVASKTGLTQLVNDREEACQQAIERRDRWQKDLKRYKHILDRVSNLDHAISPTECFDILSVAARPLGDHLPGEVKLELSRRKRADLAIAALNTVLVDLRVSTNQSEVEVQRLRELVGSWDSIQADLASLRSVADTLEKKSSELADKVKQQVESIAELQRLKANRQERVDEARIRFDRLRSAKTANEHLKVAEVVHSKKNEQVRMLESQLKSLEQTRMEAEATLNSLHELEKKRAQAKDRRSKLDTAEAQLRTWGALEDERKDLRQRGTAIGSEIDVLRATLKEAQAYLAEADDSVADAKQDLARLQESAATIDQAVAAIAAHLGKHSTQCPVCKTEFEDGNLQSLAQQAALALDPQVSQAEIDVASKVKVAMQARSEVQRLATELEKLFSEQRSITTTIENIKIKIAQHSDSDTFRESTLADAPALLQRLRGRAVAEQEEATDALRKIDVEEILADRLRSSQRSVDDVARQLSVEIQALDSGQREIAESKARVRYLKKFGLSQATEANEIEKAVVEAAEAKQLAEVLHTEAEENLKMLEEHQSALHGEQSALLSRLEGAKKERDGAQKRLDALARQWRDAGQDGEPANSVLDEESKALAKLMRQINVCRSKVDRVGQGLKAWEAADDLRQTEEQLNKEASPGSLEDRSTALEVALTNARKASRSATNARDAADSLGEILKERTSEFNNKVLQPVQKIFWRYLAALIHDERFHEIGLTPETRARSGRLHFKLSLNEWEGDGTEAELVLSEGQLAELSLAALFATSSAYKWSRWRALLLDDPTQYNDLIHATAFFDVIRNLVHFEKYQVILSTHDVQQSIFLRRKLEGMGIPCVECRYHGLGTSGVEYTVV